MIYEQRVVMAVEKEIASMLEEIEGVIRKYRVRLQGDSSSDVVSISPEIRRLKVLRFVNDRGPIYPEDLYSLAGEIGMSRQGLGGFFRGAGSDSTSTNSLLRYDEDKKIVIGGLGTAELARLERLHPSA